MIFIIKGFRTIVFIFVISTMFRTICPPAFSGVCRTWKQASPVYSIKDVVRSSVNFPEFDKHLKKLREHIGRNVVEIIINMKTIVRKTL